MSRNKWKRPPKFDGLELTPVNKANSKKSNMSLQPKQAIDALYGNLKTVREENRVLKAHLEKVLAEANKLLLGQGSSTLQALVDEGLELIKQSSTEILTDVKVTMGRPRKHEKV